MPSFNLLTLPEKDIAHSLQSYQLSTLTFAATNGGRMRPAITIFRQTKPSGEHVRIWNQRLISFAGYKTLNGTVSSSSQHSRHTTKQLQNLYNVPLRTDTDNGWSWNTIYIKTMSALGLEATRHKLGYSASSYSNWWHGPPNVRYSSWSDKDGSHSASSVM